MHIFKAYILEYVIILHAIHGDVIESKQSDQINVINKLYTITS